MPRAEFEAKMAEMEAKVAALVELNGGDQADSSVIRNPLDDDPDAEARSDGANAARGTSSTAAAVARRVLARRTEAPPNWHQFCAFALSRKPDSGNAIDAEIQRSGSGSTPR